MSSRRLAAAALAGALAALPVRAWANAAAALLPDASFPSSRDYYQPLIADPTEPAYGGRMIYPVGGARYGEITIGDYVGLTRWRINDRVGAQLNLGGGVIGRFNLSTERNALEAADFTLAVPFDLAFGRSHVVRTAYWHTSSHLGDDYIGRVHPVLTKRAFDALKSIYSWTPSEWLRLYGGGSFAFNQINLGGRGVLQTGVELVSCAAWDSRARIFLAQDLQAMERVGWNPSYTVRGGVRFSDSKHIAAASVFMEYFTGRAYYLQFQDQHDNHWGFGLRFEIGNPTR